MLVDADPAAAVAAPEGAPALARTDPWVPGLPPPPRPSATSAGSAPAADAHRRGGWPAASGSRRRRRFQTWPDTQIVTASAVGTRAPAGAGAGGPGRWRDPRGGWDARSNLPVACASWGRGAGSGSFSS